MVRGGGKQVAAIVYAKGKIGMVCVKVCQCGSKRETVCREVVEPGNGRCVWCGNVRQVKNVQW